MLGKPVPDSSVPSTGGSTFRPLLRSRQQASSVFPSAGHAAFAKFKSKLKNRYGKKVRAIVLAREWRGVKSGHVQEVLNFAKAL
jgi:hypothetical protein